MNKGLGSSSARVRVEVLGNEKLLNTPKEGWVNDTDLQGARVHYYVPVHVVSARDPTRHRSTATTSNNVTGTVKGETGGTAAVAKGATIPLETDMASKLQFPTCPPFKMVPKVCDLCCVVHPTAP